MRALAPALAALVVVASVDAAADTTPVDDEQSVDERESEREDENENENENDADALTGVEREADQLIRRGVALRTEGKEREALDEFRRAFALSPSPRARGQMGLAEKSLRLYVEAAASLDAALAANDDPWVIRNREALELARRLVAKQLSAVLVRSNVAAELWLNGRKVADLPMTEPVRVLAGEARFEVRARGHQTARLERMLIAGEQAEVGVELSPLTVVEPRTPLPPAPPDQGEAPSLAPWMYGSFALAGVGLGIGMGLGIYALDRKAARDAICPDAERCPTTEGVALDDAARDAANGATAAFVVGGAALAAGVVLLILDLTAPEGAALEVTAAGNGLRWRF